LGANLGPAMMMITGGSYRIRIGPACPMPDCRDPDHSCAIRVIEFRGSCRGSPRFLPVICRDRAQILTC
jgi:hypothetical protein